MLKNFNLKQNKTIIIIGIVIIIGMIVYFFNNNQLEKSNINDEILISNNTSNEKSTNNEEENIIVIHITGAVKEEGVVKLKEGARVIDQTTPNMIQRISGIFAINPLISRGL